jgi:hypothetical protein
MTSFDLNLNDLGLAALVLFVNGVISLGFGLRLEMSLALGRGAHGRADRRRRLSA